MPTTYLDQNALISMGRKARGSPGNHLLRAALAEGRLTIVISPWHIVETAHTTNLRNAIELAEFIDSVNPAYLLERHDLQRMEVERDFSQFLGMEYVQPPVIVTKAQAFATLRRDRRISLYDIPLRRFVEQWITHPEQLKPIENSSKMNTEALKRLRELQKAGKLTPEIAAKTTRKLFEIFLPEYSPSGVYLGRELRLQYLNQASIENIPTLSIETAISRNEWKAKGRDDWNTLIDKFHLISALPYVNQIASDDKFFKAMYPIAEQTGHVRAKLVKVADLLKGIFESGTKSTAAG